MGSWKVTREWLVEMAATNESVCVVNRSGMLVNVGRLSESNDSRKVIFESDLCLGVVDVWLADEGEVDEDGFKIEPMSDVHRARWKMICDCRTVLWSSLRTDVLVEVLKIIGNCGGGDRGGGGEPI